jgi:hypothetical protein
MNIRSINLSYYRGLFRDEAAYASFIEILRSARDLTIVNNNDGQFIGVLTTSEVAIREFLQDRLIKRIHAKPDLLFKLLDTLDDIWSDEPKE